MKCYKIIHRARTIDTQGGLHGMACAYVATHTGYVGSYRLTLDATQVTCKRCLAQGSRAAQYVLRDGPCGD